MRRTGSFIMLFALVLAVLTVAGWTMTPKLRKLTTNQALGWLFHTLGMVGVYALAGGVMATFAVTSETLALYYNCLYVVGGTTAIFVAIKVFLGYRAKTEILETKTS